MRFPFSIAVAAVRSCFAELSHGVRTGDFCLFCDLPMICFAGLAYLAKSCWCHKYQRPPHGTFLDDIDPRQACNCPHCVHTRNRRLAA